MTLQEKVQEFKRESDLMEDEIIEEKTNLLLKRPVDRKVDIADAFVLGFEFACECVSNLLENHNINPEL